MGNSELVNHIMECVLLVLICIYALFYIFDKIITKVKTKKSESVTAIKNQIKSVETDLLAETKKTVSPDKQIDSVETQLPTETKEEVPRGQYHLVLGTAEVLSRAGLIPHVKVASQEDWDTSAEEEGERRIKYGRSVIEVTEEFGRSLYRELIVPYQPELLCVITISWGLNFAAMTAENYYSRYWK